MGMMESKPAWADTDPTGELSCSKCRYKSNSEEFLQQHTARYHPSNRVPSFILYMGCSGSLDGRNTLSDRVSAQYIDMTGGQAAFEDGDLIEFGDELVAASRDTGYKLYGVYRMHDPGLGLDFPDWWVQTGVELGIFQQYNLPVDVIATGNENHNEEDNEEEGESESSEEESDSDDEDFKKPE